MLIGSDAAMLMCASICTCFIYNLPTFINVVVVVVAAFIFFSWSSEFRCRIVARVASEHFRCRSNRTLHLISTYVCTHLVHRVHGIFMYMVFRCLL